MGSDIEWIRDTSRLEALAAELECGAVAVDCEADSLHHYPEKVCLIQLSAGGRHYLIDPLAGADPVALRNLLADSDRRKLFHGADYDLRILDRDHGLHVRGLFDTMIAARLVGARSFGLAALLEEHFGVRIDKRFQRADWSQRPLPEEMERYAVADTEHLAALADRLETRLRSLGRFAWANEEFQRLERVRFAGDNKDDAWRRIRGAGRLSPRNAAVLRELWRWREERALERDRPPFMILGGPVLLELVRRLPRSSADLGQVAGLPRDWRRGRRGEQLLGLVERGLALEERDLPLPARKGKPHGRGQDARLGILKQERDRLAGELDLEPSIVATRSTLEGFVAALESGTSFAEVPEARRWQVELLRPALDRLAAG